MMIEHKSKARTIARWTIGLFGTLLLGALGSGLWEIVLRGPLVWIGNKLLEATAFVWIGYLDSIYAQVGMNYSDNLTLLPFVVSLSLLLGLPLSTSLTLRSKFLGLSRALQRVQESDRVTPELVPDLTTKVLDIERRMQRVRPLIYKVFIPLVVFVIGMAMTLAAQIIYVREVTNWTERSIEILAPYLTQERYLKLRSQFRAIETSKQFFDLESDLKSIAASNGQRLPSFSPIGKK